MNQLINQSSKRAENAGCDYCLSLPCAHLHRFRRLQRISHVHVHVHVHLKLMKETHKMATRTTPHPTFTGVSRPHPFAFPPCPSLFPIGQTVPYAGTRVLLSVNMNGFSLSKTDLFLMQICVVKNEKHVTQFWHRQSSSPCFYKHRFNPLFGKKLYQKIGFCLV